MHHWERYVGLSVTAAQHAALTDTVRVEGKAEMGLSGSLLDWYVGNLGFCFQKQGRGA